ncbi:AlpA family transcriptional regulator [Mesorhizobium sp. M1148]|uniref:helix-turn-helix transcriptional regulator n=1 Tax=unclassified Mesorhizobium TaxID=325217 RepID=UPI0003CE886A|nr:AlpA family transcriptional regulator [Mesorhizobium sp. LSJC264A00]ESX23722.1 AlpA family transcriptional regulator [Mesorhizobium sp. LSJC264A00]
MSNESNTFIRRPDVERLTGLKTSSLYEQMKEGNFPKPIKIGAKAVAWRLADVTEWQERKIAQRDAAAA